MPGTTSDGGDTPVKQPEGRSGPSSLVSDSSKTSTPLQQLREADKSRGRADGEGRHKCFQKNKRESSTAKPSKRQKSLSPSKSLRDLYSRAGPCRTEKTSKDKTAAPSSTGDFFFSTKALSGIIRFGDLFFRQLVHGSQSQRCLLSHRHSSSTKEIPVICGQSTPLPVRGCPLWDLDGTEFSPMCLQW